jgi:D-3-phosphoglycerate dehydrogenase
MAKHRCAILDDYQSVALEMADWSKVAGDLDIKVFSEPLGGPDAVARALEGFEIICAMRERTPFPRQLIEALPQLRLLVTTGMVNRAIDLEAAKARNVMVCGTPSFGNPTTGIAWGLILELTRRIGFENARLKSGALWQSVVGTDVEGLTLGVIGLGKLATRVAEVGKAFRMKVVAWSQNITPERAQAAGVEYAASKEDLLRQADIVSIHIPLTPKSRGLIGAAELGLMKPSGLLVNTSRGPIVEEAALLAALREHKIAGAGFDVYDVEPLPLEHPLRKLDNVVLTPHLGYASQQNYRAYFAGVVDDIRGFLDGKPVRVLTATG